jgi:hypothetical protein
MSDHWEDHVTKDIHKKYNEATQIYKEFIQKDTQDWRTLCHKEEYLGGNINIDNNHKNNSLFTYNKNAYNC